MSETRRLPDSADAAGRAFTRRQFTKRGLLAGGALATVPLWTDACESRRDEPVSHSSGSITNLVVNPRAARSVADYEAAALNGGVRSVVRRTGDGVDRGDACVEVVFDPSEADRSGSVGPPRVEVVPGQVVWAAAMAKIMLAERDATLELRLTFLDAVGRVVEEQVVGSVESPAQERWTRLQGFQMAPMDASDCRVWVALANTRRRPSAFRATNFLAAADPSAAPLYFDGDYPGAAWDGGPHASSSTDPSPHFSSAARRGFFFGFNDNSTQTSGVTPDLDIRLNREVGANILRVTVNLGDPAFQATRGGRIDWNAHPASYDALYDACGRAGIGFLPVALFCPPWMGVRQGFPPPREYVGDWAELAGQLASRWPEAVALEVWNEPNLAQVWMPHPDARAYAELLTATERSVKAIRPRLPILSGGLSGREFSDVSGRAIGEFLTDMYAAGAKGHFDGCSFHSYPSTPGSARLARTLSTVRTVQARNRDRKPLWLTEIGTSTGTSGRPFATPVTEDQQASVNRLLYDVIASEAGVKAVCFHTLISPTKFAPDDFEAGFEVVERSTLRRKPAFDALREARDAEQ